MSMRVLNNFPLGKLIHFAYRGGKKSPCSLNWIWYGQFDMVLFSAPCHELLCCDAVRCANSSTSHPRDGCTSVVGDAHIQHHEINESCAADFSGSRRSPKSHTCNGHVMYILFFFFFPESWSWVFKRKNSTEWLCYDSLQNRVNLTLPSITPIQDSWIQQGSMSAPTGKM